MLIIISVRPIPIPYHTYIHIDYRILQELFEHCAATPGVPDTLRDLETSRYLRALNKIFERGILSDGRIQVIDDEEILLMREGFAYFESWYELAELVDGADPDMQHYSDRFSSMAGKWVYFVH